jgi:hypothetical protein
VTESTRRAALEAARAHQFKTIKAFHYMIEREYLKRLGPDVTKHGIAHMARVVGVSRDVLASLLERHRFLVVPPRRGRFGKRSRRPGMN